MVNCVAVKCNSEAKLSQFPVIQLGDTRSIWKEMMDENKIVPRDRKAPIEILASTPSLVSWEQAPREPHLLDYLLVLRKHQWLILTFLVTVVTLVSIATFKMKPVYEATARIEIDRDTPSVLPFQAMNSDAAYDDLQNYIETESKVLQSDTLAMETIKKENLINDPAFGGVPGRPRTTAGPLHNCGADHQARNSKRV